MTTSTGSEVQLIPIVLAYLCGECSTIGNDPRQCRACACTGLVTLAVALGSSRARAKVRPAESFYRGKRFRIESLRASKKPLL